MRTNALRDIVCGSVTLGAMIAAGSAFGEVGDVLSVITPAGIAPGSNFGSGLGISGTGSVIVVGASTEASAKGAAYVFDLSDPGNPLQLAKIVPSDGASNDSFGGSIGMKGDIAYIAATGDDDNAFNSGSIYVYDLSTPAAPALLGKIYPSDPQSGQGFGIPLAVQGNLLIVNSIGAAPNGFKTGAAYLFDLSDPTNPVQVAKVVADDSVVGDFFGTYWGWGVPADENVVLFGAPGDDDQGAQSGSSYLFDLTDPANATQLAKFVPADGMPGDKFGMGWINGTIAGVGAWHAKNHQGIETGAVYLFDVSDLEAPIQLAKVIPHGTPGQLEDASFWPSAASGNLMLVGAEGYGEPPGCCGPGAAFFYDISDPTHPTLLTTVLAPAPGGFGHRVRLHNGLAFVGAPFSFDFRGALVVLDANFGECTADLDGSGTVDGGDLGIVLGEWGADGIGDLNGDGVVDGADVGLLLRAWGGCG